MPDERAVAPGYPDFAQIPESGWGRALKGQKERYRAIFYFSKGGQIRYLLDRETGVMEDLNIFSIEWVPIPDEKLPDDLLLSIKQIKDQLLANAGEHPDAVTKGVPADLGPFLKAVSAYSGREEFLLDLESRIQKDYAQLSAAADHATNDVDARQRVLTTFRKVFGFTEAEIQTGQFWVKGPWQVSLWCLCERFLSIPEPIARKNSRPVDTRAVCNRTIDALPADLLAAWSDLDGCLDHAEAVLAMREGREVDPKTLSQFLG